MLRPDKTLFGLEGRCFMGRVSLVCLCFFLIDATSGAQGEAPVIPGLHGRHPLDEVGVGRVLLEELNCAACHIGVAGEPGGVHAPDLSEVGGRVDPAYLVRFLGDPAGTEPGTRMPDLLRALPGPERAGAAEALTHFLVDQSSTRWSSVLPGGDKEDEDKLVRHRGDALFHTVGCVACHAPRRPLDGEERTPARRSGDVDLRHVPAKYGAASLAAFLFEPSHARPSGGMPDLWLNREEARDLASYLIADGERARPALEVRPELVAQGSRLFGSLGCVACHPLGGVSASDDAGREIRDPRSGCLNPGETRAPDFHLDSGQRSSILAALVVPVDQPSDRQRLARTLTAQNCIACHEREDYGGVHAEIDPWFVTDEHDLGNEARIPPSLTRVGAKLQGGWLREVLFENGNLRDYMFTRMPRFGEANVAHLPGLFERLDAGKIEPFGMTFPTGEEARAFREAGRELVGRSGLSCVACHDFNGTPSITHEGIDLINSVERLQPSWFARFMIDPQAYRPGVIMPESWPDGIASHSTILDGETDAQIRAIWFYLSEGRTARDPDGIHPLPSLLEVTDEVRTYRGRSGVAGYRGIAVGFPGGLNYAFDAKYGTLAVVWKGRFVSVRWDGQGAGAFQPLERSTPLAADVSFCRLEAENTPWPLRPHMDDENPVDPDPLYPRNHGYRFGGYSLDSQGIPALRYRSGSLTIEDRSEPVLDGDVPILRRVFRLSPVSGEDLYFRVLSGEFEKLSPRVYRTAGLRLTLPDMPIVERGPGVDRPAELLLRLPAGTTLLTLDYAFLD